MNSPHSPAHSSLRRRSGQIVETLEARRLLSFTPAASFPVGASPLAVVTGDFNGDAHLDLATANMTPVPEFPFATGTVSVLLGDGAGGFGAAINSNVAHFGGFYRVSLTVADFDHDGDDDLAYASHDPENGVYGGGVGILLSNGNGTFGSITGVQAAIAVAAGDFNNDGNSDLAVIGHRGFDIFARVLLGNGQGGFTYSPYETALDRLYEELAVGDLNGDGKLDAVGVAGEYGRPGVALLGNGGAGGYSNYHEFFPSGLQSWDVAVGDFTGDGIPDLVTSGWALDIHIGRGDGTFDEPTAYSTNAIVHTGVAVADFNGDGLLDAVTSDRLEGTVSELLGSGNGALTYAGPYAVGLYPSGIAVGDFNGDGRPDVAVANAGSNSVSVLLNDGTGPVPPPPPASMRISDATVTEGNSGSVNATFTVSLSAASAVDVTVQYSTANGTATAGSDYTAKSGTVTIPAGQTSRTFTVAVLGDRVAEPTETFAVNLSAATNATVADGQGTGIIVDNEPRISIGNASKVEGNSKTTTFSFTVSLSAAYDQAVTVNYATANGTATAGSDYTSKTGSVTFAPGETIKTITIVVNGDRAKESNETFFVDLVGPSSNALISVARGTGTIFNDDKR